MDNDILGKMKAKAQMYDDTILVIKIEDIEEILTRLCPKCGEANCLQHGYHAQPESELSELKEWQVLTGRFASMANSLANIIVSGKLTSNDFDCANKVLGEVLEYLPFLEDGE